MIRSHVAFVRDHDTSALDSVVRQLTRADAEVLRNPIGPETWHEWGLLLRVDDAIAHAFADYDRADVRLHLGRAVADAVFARNAKWGIWQSNPAAFLEAVPRLHAYLWSTGKREYRLQRGEGVVRLRRREKAGGEECWHDLGWIQRSLELCGASASSVMEISCSAQGGSCCEYLCEWE